MHHLVDLFRFRQAIKSGLFCSAFVISSSVFAFADSDLDGIPDNWEQHFGLDEFDASDAYGDIDGDGFANDTEFMRGGNPLVADDGNLPDYTVYWDGLLNEWWDQSPTSAWVTHNRLSGFALDDVLADLHSTAEVHSGLYSLAMEPARWRFLNLLHNNMDMSVYDNLEFYIHGGATGNQNLKVSLLGSTFGGLPMHAAVFVNDYVEGGNVAAGQWRKVSIPLATLLPNGKTISRVNIGWPNTGVQTLYYLDDIKFTAINDSPKLQIEIDQTQVVAEFSDDMLGSNGAYWVTNMNNPLIEERTYHAGVSSMRYPGGNSSDSFHWQDWNHSGVADWITTPDEYLNFLVNSATKGMFTANFGTGTAQEAADFASHAKNTAADVTIWEIGNEIYGNWQAANTWTHDGGAYMHGNATHDGARDYCAAIKAADDTAKVAMIGPKTATLYGRFATKVINNANSCFDYYSMHYYYLRPQQVDYHALLASPHTDIPVVTNNIRTLLDARSATQHVELAMTEFNSYSSNPQILAKHTVNMLYLADMIGQMALNDVKVANHWFIGGIPSGSNNEYYGALINYLDYTRQPSYYVFPLWNKMGDELLETTINRNEVHEVSVYSSRHSDSGDLSIMVVNKTDQVMDATIDLGNFPHSGIAYAFEAQGAALNADDVTYNGLFNPTGLLALLPPMQATVTGHKVRYDFAPYSVTVVRFEPNAQ